LSYFYHFAQHPSIRVLPASSQFMIASQAPREGQDVPPGAQTIPAMRGRRQLARTARQIATADQPTPR